jgi:hypothetical protein
VRKAFALPPLFGEKGLRPPFVKDGKTLNLSHCLVFFGFDVVVFAISEAATT